MSSPSVPDPWIGRLMGSRQRYRLDKRLNSGGMGDVFLAMDTLLGQQVAFKLLKEKLAAAEELRKRFEREVALCAALKSDHIVQVTDYGVTSEGHPFYVMEYLQGQTLGQLLRLEKRLSVKRTVDIISQVCAGLELAHKGVIMWRHGATASEHVKVVHRDLKPDNIFLVPTALGELVKILDFGIARKIHDDSAEQTNLTSAFLGTFRYAAPEQLGVAKNLDERADIYSLGIILYEMLSGADPFGFGIKARSTTGVSWALAHTSKPPQPLRSQLLCEQLSPELEAVVMRCLQKAPLDRFASVDELKGALQSAESFGQGSYDSTVNRPLAASGQRVPDTTIFQTPPPEQGSNDITIPRPLKSAGQETPDTTIFQTPPSQRHIPDATTAQIPPSQRHIPDATTAQIPTQSRHRSLPTHLLLRLGAGFAIGFAVTGAISAYFLLQHREPQVLDDIKALKTEAKYEGCITKAQAVRQDSSIYNDAQKLLNECQIEYAKKLAVGEDFEAAIKAARKIPKNSSVYPQAQVLIEQWSQQVDNIW